MPLQEKLSHAANLARWKVDQQSRIMKIQNDIRETERQINSHKWVLAETAYRIFKETGLGEEGINAVCIRIQDLIKTLDQEKENLELVKSEPPPSAIGTPAAFSSSQGNLICPNCGTPVPVRFCPNCGTEGRPG